MIIRVIFRYFFYPPPFGLEGYCRTASDGRSAGGCSRYIGRHISESTGQIFSIWNPLNLCTPVVLHHQCHLPSCLIGACPWAKICRVLTLPNAYLWNRRTDFLDFKFYRISQSCNCATSVICPLMPYGRVAPYRSTHGHFFYLCDRWMDVLRLNVCGIV